MAAGRDSKRSTRRSEGLNKVRAVVVRPVLEALDRVPGHHACDAITRYLLLSRRLSSDAPMHIAVHQVRAGGCKGVKHYSEMHCHPFVEVNILWSNRGDLVYRMECNGRKRTVKAPATIVIPAGAMHRAEAIRGAGLFFCILLAPEARNYRLGGAEVLGLTARRGGRDGR